MRTGVEKEQQQTAPVRMGVKQYTLSGMSAPVRAGLEKYIGISVPVRAGVEKYNIY